MRQATSGALPNLAAALLDRKCSERYITSASPAKAKGAEDLLLHPSMEPPMSPFWKTWLNIWCLGVALFGVVLAAGGHAGGEGAAHAVFGMIGRDEGLALDPHTRFSIALMGAVTIGWSITLFAAVQAAHVAGAHQRRLWQMLTASAVIWYVVDGYLSAHTGFATNIIPNTALLLGWLIPMAATGVLKRG